MKSIARADYQEFSETVFIILEEQSISNVNVGAKFLTVPTTQTAQFNFRIKLKFDRVNLKLKASDFGAPSTNAASSFAPFFRSRFRPG